MTTYDRPVAASLWVHLANGDQWEMTDDDLAKFGLLRANPAEYAVSQAMEAMGLDPEQRHSALRYALQRAVTGRPLGEYEDDADTITELSTWAPLVPACDPDERTP